MTKDEFISLVYKLIIPLFTGTQIIGEEESSSRDLEVALGSGGTALIKPHKSDEIRYILKRNQPFKTSDIILIRTIINELVRISEMQLEDPNYIESLQSMAIEKSICQTISEKSANVLLSILEMFSQWGIKTYEGRRMSAGIIIDTDQTLENPNPNLHYLKILNKEFIALISDGEQSCIEFDSNGYLMSHRYIERIKFCPTFCPNEFTNLARFCTSKRVGISLMESGDMLVFNNNELVFARRKGKWISYCHEEIIGLLSNRTSHNIKEIRKAIYFTALDVSFNQTGGCLVYLIKDKALAALQHIDIYDILSEKHYYDKLELLEQEKNKRIKDIPPNTTFEQFLGMQFSVKVNALNKMIKGRKFHELNRKLRAEIVAMDGATIIDYDGTIIATGAIVKIEAGSSGGGRLAATKTLAKYGVAIKISMDGSIQCFNLERKSGKTKELFSVG